MRFTAKPYILSKSLFHWIFSKLYKFKHEHFFTSDLTKAVIGQKHPSMIDLNKNVEKTNLFLFALMCKAFNLEFVTGGVELLKAVLHGYAGGLIFMK